MNEPPSSEHWNVTPDCESVNVKLIDVELVGDADGVLPVIVGVGGDGAAKTAYAPHTPSARTPSSAASINRLALLAVPLEPQRPIQPLLSPSRVVFRW